MDKGVVTGAGRLAVSDLHRHSASAVWQYSVAPWYCCRIGLIYICPVVQGQ